MNSPHEPDAFLEATAGLPNEVCLTLYFEGNCAVSAAQRTGQYLPEVGPWWDVPDTVGIRQAGQVPKGFDSIYQLSFNPTLSEKTKIVQILINLPGSFRTAWPRAASWLHDQLHPLWQQPTPEYLGYSVVYRANLKADQPVPTTLPAHLLESLQWIHLNESADCQQILASQSVEQHGWLFLVKYPEKPGEGVVYVALGKENTSKDLASKAYVERASLLAQTHMFVIKTFTQVLDLYTPYQSFEQTFLKPLKEAISKLLQHVDNPSLRPRQLNELAQHVANHTNVYWQLDSLEQSLQQQINGLERLYLDHPTKPDYPTKSMPPLPAHHLKTLQVHAQEVGALTRKNRLVLDTARTALAMVEVQESKRANESQNRFNLIVAFVGVFLAADQILDKEFANELLLSFNRYSKANEIPYWVSFFTRTATAISLATMIFGLGWLIRNVLPPGNRSVSRS